MFSLNYRIMGGDNVVCGFDKSVECTRMCKYFDTCTRNKLKNRGSTPIKVKKVEVASVKMQEVEDINDNEWMLDVLFEDDIEERIKEVLLKYSSMGLYVNQICELLSINEEIVKKVLSGVSWCRVDRKRYFYNDTFDYKNANEEILNDDSNEHKKSFTNEDKLKMMNEDIEGLLKRLKEEKGIN